MTDLRTPADVGHDGADDPSATMWTFRASTLDEAVAAARAELGDDVELVHANRVRRGGLGGFFATDLGVEIVVRRRVAGVAIGAEQDAFAASLEAELAAAAAMPNSLDAAAQREMAMASELVSSATSGGRVAEREAGVPDAMSSVGTEAPVAHAPAEPLAPTPTDPVGPAVAPQRTFGDGTELPTRFSTDLGGRAETALDALAGRFGDGADLDQVDDTLAPDVPAGSALGAGAMLADEELGRAYGSLPMVEAETAVQTALDRLIEHAEAIDRPIPPMNAHARVDTATDDDAIDVEVADDAETVTPAPLPPIGTERPMMPADEAWNPRASAESVVDATAPEELEAFEAQIRADLVDMPTRAEIAALLDADPDASGHDEPSSPAAEYAAADVTTEMERPAWAEPTGTVEMLDTIESVLEAEATEMPSTDAADEPTELVEDRSETDVDRDVELVTDDVAEEQASSPAPSAQLAPPSPRLNPQLVGPAGPTGPVEELDEMLRSVGVQVELGRHDADELQRLATTMSLEATSSDRSAPTAAELADLAHDRLIAGVASLTAGSNAPVRMLAVTITGADGTSVSISTQLDEELLPGEYSPALSLVPDIDE